MYVDRPIHACDMPECGEPPRVLTISGTLKRSPQTSNTETLAALVVKQLTTHGVKDAGTLRLADLDIKTGLEEDMGDGDEWPRVADAIRAADIVLFATPIWWGAIASPMKRAIERMDSLEEVFRQTGVSPIYNKVCGTVITGSEDGAQSVNSALLGTLQFMGFTIPPDSCTYWVGTVGDPPADDLRKIRESKAAEHMAMQAARNLAFYARLLKAHPMQLKPGKK